VISPIKTGEFVTHSAEETFELAYRAGESISGATIFLLEGDLGVGKTIFTKGIGAGLEIDPAEINSPSFTLVNCHEGRLRLYHLDLYRLESSETLDLGLEEMLSEPDAVVIIEWGQRAAIKDPAYHVAISDLGHNDRRIQIYGPEDERR
jgi:tRNA threonylcarbamoyladenosine biosynthesis protein TsaE